MKILHINTEKTWRGGEQQVLYLIKGLKERGHESTIVCQPDSPLAERARGEGISVKELRMRGGVDPVAILHIAMQLRKGYDILHLHTANAHTLGFLASMLVKGPMVVASRRVSFPPKGLTSKWKYQGVDRIIAVSEDVRKGLLVYGLRPETVVTVHSAIDLNRFTVRDEPSHPVVGVIAHLAEHKGHRYFLEAAKDILRVINNVKFLVVGDGEKRKELEEYANKLGIAENVTFVGFQKDTPKMISQCTITVLPSISGEGSPGVLKESMAAGIPVVTTDIGGSREIVEDGVTGLVVQPKSSAALSSAIIRLLKNKELRTNMRRMGLKRVEEFGTDRMVEGTLAVYKRMLGKR